MFYRLFKRFPADAMRRFTLDRAGVAAVEFAIIAPLLILIYFMMVEASQAIDTNKKLDRSAYTVADLITQQSTITKIELDNIMTLGENLLRPYERSKPVITVAMYKRVGGSGEFQWASARNGAAPSGPDATPPASLAENDFYLKTTVNLPYIPIMAWSQQSRDQLNLTDFNIGMSATRVLVPRVADTACTDC